MKERFESIVEFSELEEFIDQPVKYYSSGMYVRLGFAVAVEVDPDILLIDEVLAVGDAAFRRKCISRMDEFKKQGKTMLIISHDMGTVQSISDRILLLDEGRIIGMGNPGNMIGQYRALSGRKAASGLEREWGTAEVRIIDVKFFNEHGELADTFKRGAALEVRVSYEADHSIMNPIFGFSIADEAGRLIYGNNTQIEEFDIPVIDGKGSLILRLKQLSMSTGTYLFSFSVHSADHRINYHRLDNHFSIAVESEKKFEGCYMDINWSMR